MYAKSGPLTTSSLCVWIWIACLCHGLTFVMCTPLWEGFDEAFHYSYIQTLAEHRTLPVYGQSTTSLEITESFEQAPVSVVVYWIQVNPQNYD
jgi:hypothetical protein